MSKNWEPRRIELGFKAKKEKEKPKEQSPQAKQEESKPPGNRKKKVKYKNRKANSNEDNSKTEKNRTSPKLMRLKKSSSFHDSHKRITTYLENEVYEKVMELKEEENISIKDLLSESLKDFFKRYDI